MKKLSRFDIANFFFKTASEDLLGLLQKPEKEIQMWPLRSLETMPLELLVQCYFYGKDILEDQNKKKGLKPDLSLEQRKLLEDAKNMLVKRLVQNIQEERYGWKGSAGPGKKKWYFVSTPVYGGKAYPLSGLFSTRYDASSHAAHLKNREDSDRMLEGAIFNSEELVRDVNDDGDYTFYDDPNAILDSIMANPLNKNKINKIIDESFEVSEVELDVDPPNSIIHQKAPKDAEYDLSKYFRNNNIKVNSKHSLREISDMADELVKSDVAQREKKKSGLDPSKMADDGDKIPVISKRLQKMDLKLAHELAYEKLEYTIKEEFEENGIYGIHSFLENIDKPVTFDKIVVNFFKKYEHVLKDINQHLLKEIEWEGSKIMDMLLTLYHAYNDERTFYNLYMAEIIKSQNYS